MAGSPIPATGVAWSTSVPDDQQPHGNDYNEHRESKLALAIRSNKEHVAYGAASAGGEHKAGSAVSYIGDYSVSSKGDSLPTTRPNGAALSSADYGRLAYDTDVTYGGVAYIYTSTGWIEHSVAKSQAQTIAGIKTFSASPIIPLATTPTQAASLLNITNIVGSVTMLPLVYAGEQSIKLTNGLIIKAGLSGNITHSSYLDIVFSTDIAFNTVLYAFATVKYATVTGGSLSIYVTNLSTTGLRLVLDNVTNSYNAPAYWLALGY